MRERDARALLVGGMVVAVGWLVIRGLPAGLTGIRAAEAAIDQQAALLSRAHAQMRELSELERTVDAFERVSESLHRRLLSGWDTGTAQFDLSRRLHQALPDSVIPEREVAAVEDTTSAGDLRRVLVRATFRSDIASLLSIIDGLERDSVLGLERVSLQETAADNSEPTGDHLDVRITVSGWFLPDTSRTQVTDGGSGR